MGRCSISSNGSVLDCDKNIDSHASNGCCIALDYDEYKARLRCSFEQMLSVFLKEISCRGIVRPVPAVLGDRGSLDLFELFMVVRDHGGYHVVSEKELWSLVVVELGLDLELSASVKLIYSKYLCELEKWLMVRCGGRKLENGNSEYHREEIFHFSPELEAKFEGVFCGVLGEKSVYDECFKFISNKQSGNNNSEEKEMRFPGTKKKECEQHGDVTKRPKNDGKKSPKNDGKMIHDGGENGCTQVNEDCKILDSANVEAKIISAERNQESLLRMLKWVRRIAKHPVDPSNGIIPERSKLAEYSSSNTFWIQIVRARDALLIRKDDGANTKKLLLQKKVKMHPSIYEDNIDNHHLSTERIRCSKRLNTSVSPVVISCNNSSSTVQSNLISSTRTEIEKGLEKQGIWKNDLQPTKVEIRHDEDSVEKLVPVGALFQAVVPEWTGKISDSDSKWLGTPLWPLQHEKKHNLKVDINPVGRGRPDSCNCRIPGSVECVRFHIAEARMKLKLELGLAFYHWRFHQMGEEISLQWTTEEEKRFKDLVRENFNSQTKCFWNHSLKWFPKKSRKSLISYYFNVFLLQQRSYQNRVTPNEIDSDDDEVEFGRIGGDFGTETIKLIGFEPVECSENKQCTDME